MSFWGYGWTPPKMIYPRTFWKHHVWHLLVRCLVEKVDLPAFQNEALLRMNSTLTPLKSGYHTETKLQSGFSLLHTNRYRRCCDLRVSTRWGYCKIIDIRFSTSSNDSDTALVVEKHSRWISGLNQSVLSLRFDSLAMFLTHYYQAYPTQKVTLFIHDI